MTTFQLISLINLHNKYILTSDPFHKITFNTEMRVYKTHAMVLILSRKLLWYYHLYEQNN